MKNILDNVKTIGVLLSVLFGISLINYLFVFHVEGFSWNTVFLIVLFVGSFVGSLAVICLQDWGRVVLVLAHAFLAVYFIKPYLIMDNILSIGYVSISIIIILFFTQEQTKTRFLVKGGKVDWKSILVVDDDETLLRTIRPILITHGYSVLTANTGESGLQVAISQKPDLIILDVILPGMIGRKVCENLKSNPATKNIPVVFLTAKDSAYDIQAEMDVGGEAHLTKPVNAKALIETIRNVLKMR